MKYIFPSNVSTLWSIAERNNFFMEEKWEVTIELTA